MRQRFNSLGLALILAAFATVACSDNEDSKRKAAERADQLVSKAVQDPNTPAQLATTNAAQSELAKMLSTTDGRKKKELAAGAFLGYYYKHVDGYANYCLSRGVSIPNFVSTFSASHVLAYKQASRFLSVGDIRSAVAENAQKHAAASIEDAARGYKITPAELCKAFDSDASNLVPHIHASRIIPEVYAALLK